VLGRRRFRKSSCARNCWQTHPNDPIENGTRTGRPSARGGSGARRSDKRTKRGTKKGELDSCAPNFSSGLKNDSQAKNRPEPKAQADLAEAFERFWHAYPRKVGRAAAQAAFERAVEGGAELELLIAAAGRFAVIRAGEPERYTPYASRWLRERRWEDPPPAGAVIDQDGNVVAIEQEQDDGSADGVFETCQKMAAIAYRGKPW
jgi:hypothetical protein